MNKYIVIFVKAGGVFGIAMGLFYSLQHINLRAGMAGGLVADVLFGFAIAAVAYVADRKLRKKEMDTSSADVRQCRSLKIKGMEDTIFPICKEALLSIKKATLTKEDVKAGTLVARIGFSWKSFGEVIEVLIKPLAENGTLIEIVSAPSGSLTVVDYGKNLENVEAIMSYLQRRLGVADSLTGRRPL